MTSPLRIALVGCGIISENHIRAYQHHSLRARVTVCCDIDERRARERAELAGGARAVTSLDEALSDPDVDAIDLCTPPHLHPEAVIAAARAGKHVSCQKPLARTLAECDAMIDAAREAGVVLYHAEMYRTAQAIVLAKLAVATGRVGQIVGIQGTMAYWQGGEYMGTRWRYDPALSGGGQLLDSAIHAVDALRNLGGDVESVSCFTARFRPELGGDDTSALNLLFRAGYPCSLFSSQATGLWYPGPALLVFGTEGVLAIASRDEALVLHRSDLPGGREVLLKEQENVFNTMIGAFLDTVLDGAPNASPPEEGRENLRVVLAAYESERTGCAVKI